MDTLMAGRTVLLVTHGAYDQTQEVVCLDRGRRVPAPAAAAPIVATAVDAAVTT